MRTDEAHQQNPSVRLVAKVLGDIIQSLCDTSRSYDKYSRCEDNIEENQSYNGDLKIEYSSCDKLSSISRFKRKPYFAIDVQFPISLKG